jgi:flagellar biosynthesis/type III secretory pathway M-ring protein FliF/YscJ
MALSIEEQRLLSEIASRLSADDPRLADRLSTLGRTRQRQRIMIIVAVVVAVLVVVVAIAAVAVATS